MKEKKETSSKNGVKNTKVKDNAAQTVFGDPILCAQFLRGYTNIPALKDVQPEDIEDVSSKFLPMFQESRESDAIKKIKIKGQEMFLIAIIEHQSEIHFDMAFRLLRYFVMILTDYAAEQEKLHPGITKTKDFKYPPVLPIVYYEGKQEWSAVQNFKDRVYLNDVFEEFIPDFKYLVVPLNEYTNQELMEKNDELSLIFLINKLRTSSEFKELKELTDLSPEYVENLNENTPEYLLRIIGKVVGVLLHRLNVPDEEVYHFTDQITRRKFDMMFDSFEAYDVQETRRVSKAEGKQLMLIEMVLKKIAKNYTAEQTADMLEMDIETVQKIYNIAADQTGESDPEKILEGLQSSDADD